VTQISSSHNQCQCLGQGTEKSSGVSAAGEVRGIAIPGAGIV